ncbi:DNA-binding protein [Pseudomonas sp. WN033]|nr:DNA-binding protein [Pseudomonas sp. WN033]
MTDQRFRVLPELNDLNRFFWTSGADKTLRILRCADCRHWLHPPGIICPQCLSQDLSAEPVSGFGSIEAITVNHQPWSPDQPVPYAIAIVSLDEQPGLQLTTNIVGCEPEAAFIGQRVRVVFEEQEDVFLPLFTPV